MQQARVGMISGSLLQALGGPRCLGGSCPIPNMTQGGETNPAKIGPGHWLINAEAKYPIRGRQREENFSLILACCRGKAGEARPAVFVTLLLLGHQEKLRWHHRPATEKERKWQFDCPTLGQNPQIFSPLFWGWFPRLRFQARSESNSWKNMTFWWFLKVE